MRFVALIVLVAFSSAPVSFAKRAAPSPVHPAFTASLRIEAPIDDGRVGRVEVFDRSDGHLLWSAVIFENKIDRKIEEDVQWHFIQAMRIRGDTVEITREDGARYDLSLITHRVGSPEKSGANKSSDPTTESVTPRADARVAPLSAVGHQ